MPTGLLWLEVVKVMRDTWWYIRIHLHSPLRGHKFSQEARNFLRMIVAGQSTTVLFTVHGRDDYVLHL